MNHTAVSSSSRYLHDGRQNPSYISPETQKVRFKCKAVYNDEKSFNEGRPIHDLKIYVRIICRNNEAGTDDLKEIEATEDHKTKFSAAWRFFEEFIAPEVMLGYDSRVDLSEIKDKFPQAWKKYIDRIKDITNRDSGTLLTSWNQISIERANDLKFLGVFFVEDIELCPYSSEKEIMAAREFLRSTQEQGYINQLALRVNELTEELKKYMNNK